MTMKSENRKLMRGRGRSQATGHHLVIPEPHLSLPGTCVHSSGGIGTDLICKSTKEGQ